MSERHRWGGALVCALVLLIVSGGLFASAHQQGRRESLHERKGRLREARLEPAGTDHVSAMSDLTLTSTSGLEGRALVRSPRDAPPRVPAAVVLGGINRGRRIATVPGLDAIAARSVVIGLDYPLPSRRRSREGLQAIATF